LKEIDVEHGDTWGNSISASADAKKD